MGICLVEKNTRKNINQIDSEENKYRCKFTIEQLRNKLNEFEVNSKIIKNDD